jgi:hypothetical protein
VSWDAEMDKLYNAPDERPPAANDTQYVFYTCIYSEDVRGEQWVMCTQYRSV